MNSAFIIWYWRTEEGSYDNWDEAEIGGVYTSRERAKAQAGYVLGKLVASDTHLNELVITESRLNQCLPIDTVEWKSATYAYLDGDDVVFEDVDPKEWL